METRYVKHLQVFSQNDEDGAIEEVFRKIGTTDKVKHLYILEQNLLSICKNSMLKVYVEFGVQNGDECNTRYLR